MDRSEQLFERAKRVLPGGVNSPVRAYRAVGMAPRFITRADGAYIYDEDGKRYIDYVCSWGPMILGHNHPVIREVVEQAVKDGLSFGAPTRREVEIAELMIGMVPNIEMVRMVNSGTEAVMSALRLARGATGRDKLIKFEGCYHGHSDSLLVKAGSGALTNGNPSSAGVPKEVAEKTLVARYNETGLEEAVRDAVGQFNASAVAPENATVSYDEAAGSFSIVPEQIGTALDADAVVEAADSALAALDEQVTLTEDHLLQPSIFESDTRLAAAVDEANTMIGADLVLQMAGTTVGEVNAELVAQWVSLDGDLNAVLDEGALTAWVDELAAQCGTVGTERSYTRADGKAVTVSGGVYGWSVDRDTLLGIVKEGVKSGRTGTVDVPCSTTGTAYNGAGARDWGSRYLDIDLSEQYVRFYDEAGALVWESACVTGTPNGEHDTPSGVYWLNQKQSPSTLVGYDGDTKIYETKVQYWMPFVGNAIGLHDADWQPDFGGTLYKEGFGSHGCVNLPPSKAGELYGLIQGGDVVVCHW